MKKLTLCIASLCLCFSVVVDAQAEERVQALQNLKKRVQEKFGADGPPVAAAMYPIALGPVMRQVIFYAPLSVSFFLEIPSDVPPPTKDQNRFRLLNKLSAITETPYYVISLQEIELKASPDNFKLKELLTNRLIEILKERKDRPVHIAFRVPNLESSPDSLTSLRLLYQYISQVKIGNGSHTYYLENVDFIFFATAPQMNERIAEFSRSALEQMMLHRMKIPAPMIARMNQVAAIDLETCEPYLENDIHVDSPPLAEE